MRPVYERAVVLESLSFDSDGDISFTSGDVAVLDRRLIRMVGNKQADLCNGCGEVRPDVDLWAEDSVTGEELWLCQSCGEW